MHGIFADPTAGKHAVGTEYERLSTYRGVFYYHKGRLTLPLHRTTLQNKQTTNMITSQARPPCFSFASPPAGA